MVEIFVNSYDTGEDAVGEYIARFWEHNGIQTVIVSIGVSYDGISFDDTNEVVAPDPDGICCEFLHDWWEGQKYIRIYGIQTVQDLSISGGLYDE